MQADIGFHDFEIGSPQRLLVTVEVWLEDLRRPPTTIPAAAGTTTSSAPRSQELAAARRYNLQETLAHAIFERVAAFRGVQALRVRLSKPDVYADADGGGRRSRVLCGALAGGLTSACDSNGFTPCGCGTKSVARPLSAEIRRRACADVIMKHWRFEICGGRAPSAALAVGVRPRLVEENCRVMSYAQRKQLSGNPVVAWTMTYRLWAALLYAIVTGLAYNVVKKAHREPEGRRRRGQAAATAEGTAATAEGHAEGAAAAGDSAAAGADGSAAAADPDGDRAAAANSSRSRRRRRRRRRRRARCSRRRARRAIFGLCLTADDYPASAQAAGAEGTAQATLTIGPDGRVVACNITQSTGNSALDSATCNILRRRAKFTPARDSNGNPTTDTLLRRRSRGD